MVMDIGNDNIGNDNAGQPSVSEQPGTLAEPVPTRRARKPTRMARLTLRYPGKVKILFDSRRFMAVGPKKTITDNFRSYLGFLGRKQPSILMKSWEDVSANTKEMIWQAILEKFDIFLVDGEKEVEFSSIDVKLQEKFRRKWVNYVRRRWNVFKTNLTSTYIYGKKKDQPPYVKDYEFLDKETWEAFVASRLSEEEKAKRLKAQQVQSHNKCPQRCSRGGYEVLKQKIIDEKLKARQQASDDPSKIIQPPSPPSRHETWKRARIKPSGDFINEETSAIAAKIDALEQEASSGSFKPSGRNDILTVAIGKPDHPTRVRGVGTGYTVRSYFGKQQRAADGMVSREEVAVIVAEMKAEMQANLRAEMKMILSSQATSASEPLTPAGMSAKGSCAPDLVPSNQQEDEQAVNDVRDEVCELYVEDPQKRLVAYGRIHMLGSNIHNRKMNGDEVRVSVERVLVEDALVPFPTDEVTVVGEALNQFIAWPKRLVVENVKQGNSQQELFPKTRSHVNAKPQTTPVDKTNALKTLWVAAADIKEPRNQYIEAGIVGLTRMSVYINQVDIMGLLATGAISVAVMKFYTKCLYNILKSSGRNDRYGLMCPFAIQTQGNIDMGLIRNRIGEGGFECFLLPFYDKGWELMALCPNIGSISWFSCAGKSKKTKKKFPEMIETAFEAYHLVKGLRSNTLSKPKWVYPKCCNDDVGDAGCGLFVMRHMLEIIKLDICNSFEKVLSMEEPYSSDDIDDVRKRWAECFLEVI
ncbi:Proteasome subunit beta type-3 [Castilleja foliolosa]|uniref:Proteasome subunit beta type-3 n=1 Tax=Castilleja foliolosa TaxID=1961234 RepID=A0ABD3CEM0_9LAMI